MHCNYNTSHKNYCSEYLNRGFRYCDWILRSIGAKVLPGSRRNIFMDMEVLQCGGNMNSRCQPANERSPKFWVLQDKDATVLKAIRPLVSAEKILQLIVYILEPESTEEQIRKEHGPQIRSAGIIKSLFWIIVSITASLLIANL